MRDNPGGAAILLYHRVAQAQSDVHRLCVAPKEFRAQMDILGAEYRVIPLAEMADGLRDGRVPDRAVSLTFDDGYFDNYSTALPILDAVGLPATFFVTTDRLDSEYEFWWDALERVLLAPGPALPPVLELDFPDGPRAFATATHDDRVTAHWSIYRVLFDGPSAAIDDTTAALIRWSGRILPPGSAHRRMRGDEMAQVVRRGHAIEAHTVRHVMLPRQSPEAQRLEISESRRDLEALLGQPVRAFAYPFGALDASTRAIVRESFDLAVTCEESTVTDQTDPWSMPRLEVRPPEAVAFEKWLRGWLPS